MASYWTLDEKYSLRLLVYCLVMNTWECVLKTSFICSYYKMQI